MIDTIKGIGTFKRTEELDILFNNPEAKQINSVSKSIRIISYKNLKITLLALPSNEYKISIQGSINKAIVGNNYLGYERGKIKSLFIDIQKQLGISLNKLTLTRVDVGVAICLRQPVSNYLPNLFRLGKMKRDCYNYGKETVRFRSVRKELCCYNKNAETIKKEGKKAIPQGYQNLNALRVELKLLKMGGEYRDRRLTIESLYSRWFYRNITEQFINEIRNIEKERPIEFLNPLIGLKQFHNYLAITGIKESGGMFKMMHQIESYDIPLAYQYKFKKRTRELNANQFITKPSDLMKELERRLISEIRKYRPKKVSPIRFS